MIQQLYIIAHKDKGVIFAVGNTAELAWRNALEMLHPSPREPEHFLLLGSRASRRQDLQRRYFTDGWRARRFKLEISGKGVSVVSKT